jgi:mannose-6-phosphate isomerase
VPPIPVVFEPIFKPKPWGGRRLADLFGKRLPSDVPVGESWELADLPGSESRVARGPLAGKRIRELMKMWGAGFLGEAAPLAGRFPLLIKFLDAREALSVQVHPSGAAGSGEPPGIKHEAWYVVDSEPASVLFIGLRPGVTPEHVRAAGSTPALANLLQKRPADLGACYYLPSGIPHALGAGVVVAEVQVPSDVTYRLYDWGRLGLDGRPRELHVEKALANLRCDVPEHEIVQPSSRVPESTTTRLMSCERFEIYKLGLRAGLTHAPTPGQMAIWIAVSGSGVLTSGQYRCPFRAGDVLAVPAAAASPRVETSAGCEVLEVRIPAGSVP